MSKKQRNKGAAGEREVCHLIADKTGINVSRQLEQARDGGGDIKALGLNIEVKRRMRIGNIYDWMEQSKNACKENEKPVVFCRADRKDWLVVLSADDFLDIIQNAR